MEQNLFIEEPSNIKSAHVNAFVDSALDVLKRMGKVEASVIDLTKQKRVDSSHPLSIFIDFTGDLKGTFIIRFQEDVACSIGGGMMGEGPVAFDPACREALAELTNVIVGNATGHLADMGFHIRITPPLIRFGAQECQSVQFKQDLFVVSLRTDPGFIELNLSFEEGQ